MASTAGTQGPLEALVARFAHSRQRLPDLTGLDWALDHGWITHAEHVGAEEQHQEHAVLCADLRRDLAAIRERDPEGYARGLAESAALAQAVADIEGWRVP